MGFFLEQCFPYRAYSSGTDFLTFLCNSSPPDKFSLRAKREPERTAVLKAPVGLLSRRPVLQSKCRVFSAARSPLLSRRGRRRVAAPCVCVPCAALASCRPLLPQQLLPVSAAGRGRRRFKGCSPLIIPKQMGSIQKTLVAAQNFLCWDFKSLTRRTVWQGCVFFLAKTVICKLFMNPIDKVGKQEYSFSSQTDRVLK